mgnify:CR=1
MGFIFTTADIFELFFCIAIFQYYNYVLSRPELKYKYHKDYGLITIIVGSIAISICVAIIAFIKKYYKFPYGI